MTHRGPWTRLQKSIALTVFLLVLALGLLALSLATELPLRDLAAAIGGLGGASIGFVALFAIEDRKRTTGGEPRQSVRREKPDGPVIVSPRKRYVFIATALLGAVPPALILADIDVGLSLVISLTVPVIVASGWIVTTLGKP